LNEPLLRFITCGSVDDGKSTFIGRLLYESRCVFEDQLRALETDSRRFGTQGSRLDFALLVDGLQAEREQGITIDVAYRFFATPRRRFIVADTPGHEQYTRNMATGASTAELAVILIDARKGVLPQTRRHTRIAAMMGIRHVLLAVNKMDLVDYDQRVFETIVDQYGPFAASCGVTNVRPIPVSALEGDNLIAPGPRTPWYDGPTVMHYLETVEPGGQPSMDAFRMPVQWINRPDQDFRGFSGRVCAGAVHPGDRVRVLPSGLESQVAAIVTMDGERRRAEAGDSITLTLTDEVDVSRGDVIAAATSPPAVSDQFEARLLWMTAAEMIPGRTYLLKTQSKEVRARVTAIKYRVDIASDARLAARTLALNDIGVVNLSTTQPIPFEPYTADRTLGSSILVDPMSFETVAAGMIDFALRRASNVHWQALEISRERRAEAMGQKPCCIWFTGLSGSGKSTIANRLERRLFASGRHTYLLDGDNVRHGLNRDLGFTEADRTENIRRVAEVARLMVDAGLVVLVSFISPFRSERQFARSLFGDDEFIEVFVDTPIEECERRDVKGLYAKARSGQLPNFTGIASPYEPPEEPEVHLRTTSQSVDESADEVFSRLP
jgi:bifunctional enzyme CysN/CysC